MIRRRRVWPRLLADDSSRRGSLCADLRAAGTDRDLSRAARAHRSPTSSMPASSGRPHSSKRRTRCDCPRTARLGARHSSMTLTRADRSIDEIAESFDFLLAVTPINADAAWQEFRSSGFRRAPRFLYRPLTVQVDAGKRKLFSIAFDSFEDPVLLRSLPREAAGARSAAVDDLGARDAAIRRIRPGALWSGGTEIARRPRKKSWSRRRRRREPRPERAARGSARLPCRRA